MKKLTLIFLFLANICFSQNVKPKENEAVINLSITDSKGKSIQTEIIFKSLNKKYSFRTDINGQAKIIVEVGHIYTITIPSSFTYYDYEILDYPSQIQDLSLEFPINEKINMQKVATDDNALIILSTFNLPEGKEIEIIDEKTKITHAVTKQDTFKIAVPIDNKYRIKIEGYTIKNDIVSVAILR